MKDLVKKFERVAWLKISNESKAPSCLGFSRVSPGFLLFDFSMGFLGLSNVFSSWKAFFGHVIFLVVVNECFAAVAIKQLT